MDNHRNGAPPDWRLERILNRLAEMDELVDRLPEPERAMAEVIVSRIRRDLQPVLDALKWKQ